MSANTPTPPPPGSDSSNIQSNDMNPPPPPMAAQFASSLNDVRLPDIASWSWVKVFIVNIISLGTFSALWFLLWRAKLTSISKDLETRFPIFLVLLPVLLVVLPLQLYNGSLFGYISDIETSYQNSANLLQFGKTFEAIYYDFSKSFYGKLMSFADKLYYASIPIYIVLSFRAKKVLEDHFQVKLSAPLTFFFSVFYLQKKMQELFGVVKTESKNSN